MSKEFEMSMIGELKYFLGLQIKQNEEGIFINQAKYVKDLLKRFGYDNGMAKRTPMSTTIKLDKDEKGKEVDIKTYRGMIKSLLYLTTSRPDIMFSVCLCARFQSCPKESHMLAVKRIFRYLIGTINLGLWYPRGTHIDLTYYSDFDFGGYKVDRKSTSGTCHFLGHSLVSWFSKKQNLVALSTTEAEYIAAVFRRRENSSFMASTSSSTPVTLSSTLSLPKSCTSHTANKIENLVEYSYIPESAQIIESSYPLISPYQLYKHPSSFTCSIRTLISTRRPHPKEYIQSSRLDQCSLQATPTEQYVTLEIPSELISNWKREGYTHLHLEGIRLILTLHGRKGLPVTARIAMLNTRFKQYQDAVIGTVLTTLHAGSVLLTFYPNFNLSLQDTNLPTALKVQVQIQGAEQISSAKIATLHHQLVYQLQNHALDLPTPEHHSDTLMVLAESDQIPTIIQIPRQIPRHELIKLMSLEWISNYEQFHTNTAPIQTSESMFNSEGYPVYPAKHNGHFLWDVPGSGMCDPNCPWWDDWEEDDDYAPRRKKKPKRKKPPVPCQHCEPKSPKDPPPPPAPLPIYRKELKWIVKHCKSEISSPLPNPTPTVQPLACMMFSSTSSDSSSCFPPLEPHTDSQQNVVSKPFIPSSITSTGHLEPPKPFESVLNWQTQNARAQNDTLLHLNSKVEKISLRTEQIEMTVDYYCPDATDPPKF
ncbi:hypothetical protein KPL71_014606 [Citrus sinensis]|uniref:Uncharacterized protein n=1 Tax=Citrus sinensis TaxID=2711 RepID=A0ACB8KCQ2_CITSI|nr:hypothetical protein KPL71_014606 [Citrus sinensis]